MDNTTNSTFNGTFSGNGTFNGTSDPFTTPTPKPFWTGLLLPTAYLIILIGSLYSFSSVYRQRQVSRASKLEPWFPQHVTRNIYLSLLHLDPETASADSDDEKKLSKVPDSVLKAALLKRAVEDIQRIVQLRQAKPALQTLLQRGSVGDELWQRFQRAEQEMEIEVKDVVNEVSLGKPYYQTPHATPILITPSNRPTHSPQTGAKSSSSPPTKSTKTSSSSSASPKCKPISPPTRPGGRTSAPESRANSWRSSKATSKMPLLPSCRQRRLVTMMR